VKVNIVKYVTLRSILKYIDPRCEVSVEVPFSTFWSW